jgi:hypothetical protein
MEPVKCFLLLPTDRAEYHKGEIRPIYIRQDARTVEMVWQRAPVGAMVYATWLEEDEYYFGRFAGPDGRILLAKVPANPDGTGRADWIVDGQAEPMHAGGNGYTPGWVRTGTPPKITVVKEIAINPPKGWRGFIRDGVITSE